MEKWKELEFEYAAELRSVDAAAREDLYGEAYSSVAAHRTFKSIAPEDRTAGTSQLLVQQLRRFIAPSDEVLEIGCGRGYTCMKLAPHVASIIGTEVSEPSIREARALLVEHGLTNASILNVSATHLLSAFPEKKFDTAVSIEVIEHLHADDAQEHLRQIFFMLKPGGKYILTMPNRLNGPHDITREEYPSEKKALGFHLNESTYTDMIRVMSAIGFSSFYSFRSLRSIGIGSLTLPAFVNVAMEDLFQKFGGFFAEKFLSIQLVAHKR